MERQKRHRHAPVGGRLGERAGAEEKEGPEGPAEPLGPLGPLGLRIRGPGIPWGRQKTILKAKTRVNEIVDARFRSKSLIRYDFDGSKAWPDMILMAQKGAKI